MQNKHLFPYKWNLSDGYPAKDIEKHGCKVFGTFICGGGSSMGYKLAGYLVFIYCDTIQKLMPKVCLLENVSGLLKGNGKAYAKKIMQKIEESSYNVQVFLLNAATMGVPQMRERTFIIGLRNDYKLPKLQLNFNEPAILFREIQDDTDLSSNLTPYQRQLWNKRKPTDYNFGDIIEREEHRLSMFSNPIFHTNRIPFTLTSSAGTNALFDLPRGINEYETKCISTFPQDYNSGDVKLQWLVGMSVPPVMTAQISYQIYQQWLKPIASLSE